MRSTAMDERLAAALGPVVEELPDAVLLLGRDGRALVRNAAARSLPPEILGHRCREEVRGSDPSCPACQVEGLFRGGGPVRWHLLAGDGSEQSDIHEITVSPVRDGAGSVVAVLAMVRDATAMLRLENYLIRVAEESEAALDETSKTAREHRKRAESLHAELGAVRDAQAEMLVRDRLRALTLVVAGLAHEINTPLGALLSGAALMERTLERLRSDCGAGKGDEDAIGARLDALAETARLQIEAARRIDSVMRALRLFSHLDEAPLKPYELHRGLDATLELLRYRLGKRIRIVREYGKIPRVTCRPDACNQVFLNLLRNAADAVEGEGEISVSTRREGGTVVVEIRDTGRGIPKEDLPRIFDLGYTTRGLRGGSGIGLTLVRKIVREHGGDIEITSVPGRGTRVRVSLPVTPPADRR